MAKSLVVVESPAKARTIKKYLGSGYEVKASKGHVRDLPKSALGVDVEDNFKPKYTVSRDRTKLLKELRDAAKKADTVYLATDLDREGEAIAWHLAEALKLDPETTYRVVFNEITKSAIQAAFSEPGRVDMKKVDAQQARRILDRLVGYKLSPLLWRRVRRGLSAGRVQSVAVRLVVEREREIEAFKPEEYWRIRATLTPAGISDESQRFLAELVKYEGEKFRPVQGEQAEAVAAALREAAYTVIDRKVRTRKDKAPPPFTTSELQQAASTQLRFASRRTMSIAQQLYEGVDLGQSGPTALITYMRTDSHHLAASAVSACRDLIGKEFGAEYVPEKPHFFTSRAGAQEAHEAIRPTDVSILPDAVRGSLTDDQYNLYSLIWKRFVASQMKPAEWEVTDLSIRAGAGELKAIGRTLVYDGHTRVTGLRLGKDEQMLPRVDAGAALDLVELKPSQHFTQPPPRYSEAGLIRELESRGIGRPSTYAAILSTIEERGYVEQKQRRYWATDLGKIVTDKLVEHFPRILNVEFTSHMEDDLDKVETGEMGYVDVLTEFYTPFKEALDAADRPAEMKIDAACPECGRPMIVRSGRRGPFRSCSGYPKCKATGEATPEEIEKFNAEFGEQQGLTAPQPKDTGRTCPECGGKLLERLGRFGLFVGCENYPKCKFIEKAKRKPPEGEQTDVPCPTCGKPLVKAKSRRGVVHFACPDVDNCGAVLPAAPDETPMPIPPCPECGKPMTVRFSRGEPFLGCSGYPKCRGTISLGPKRSGKGGTRRPRTRRQTLETDVACDKCGKKMIVRMSRRGPFLACPGYPKCKNAKDATPEQIEQFNALQAEAEAEAETSAGDDNQANDKPAGTRKSSKRKSSAASDSKDADPT
ncbi:MAG: type I DNA topoisomerase [Planctomycetes bacterium]|nr:type I DNA topoisomerase [Planctomycetota bacterium]